MEELMAALKATEASIKTFDSDLKETKKRIEDDEDPYEKRRRTASSGLIDYNSAKKAVQKSSPVVAFSKTKRFGTPAQQDLNSSIESNSTVESNTSLSAVKTRSPAIMFGKTKRFQEAKSDTKREFDLNPKYDYVKKRETATVIKAPTSVEPKVRIAKKLQLAEKHKSAKSPTKSIDPRNEESIETVRLEDQERGTCAISDILSDTTEYIGPGAYTPNYGAVEARKSVGFAKAARFRTTSEEMGTTELNPKFDYVKKGISGVKIAKDTEKNEKLLKKKEEEERYKEISSQMRRAAPVENDAAVRKNVPGVVMKDEMEALSEEERLHRIFNLLDRRRAERKIAPGTYEPKDQDEPVCTVVYRKSLSPKVMRLPERPPSPTRYYAKDDLIKTNQPAFSFMKEGVDKTPKLEDFDMRKPLDINLNLVKPRAPGAIVMPEHKYEAEPDLTDIKVGPGTYEPSHDLTEKRTDIGVIKFADLNDKNTRENQMDLAKKDIFDADLDPNYDATKPRAPGFVYHKPVELEGPAHLPDSLLHPEQWRFYDSNINAIKPDVGEVEFAGGLTREQFLEKEEDMNQFLAYQARKVKKPAVGQYDVKYSAIEPEERAPDFAKYIERDLDVIDKENVEVEGDVLILNPDKPKPRLPDIKFDTQLGREEEKGRDEDREELLLEPSYDLVKPRPITYVDLSKQQERKMPFDKKVDENQEELLLEVNYNPVEPRVKGIPDIKKLTSREDLEAKRNENEDHLVLNPVPGMDPETGLMKPDTKHTMTMDSKTKRFTELEKENPNDGRTTTSQTIDYNKALDATRPNKDVVNFDRYSDRETSKESRDEKSVKKQLKELNKKIKKADLPVIEEEAFEKYPKEENQGGDQPAKPNKVAKLTTKRGSKILKENSQPNATEVKEVVEEKADIEPWDNGNE